MEENIRDPREDISYIKNILAKTADGMKSIAPYFSRFGWIWLVFGLFSAVHRLVMNVVSESAAVIISQTDTVIAWLFYLALAAGFLVVRRKQKRRGLDTLALKLIDMWGTCIYVFLALTVCLTAVLPAIAVRALPLPFDAAVELTMNCALCQSCLIFLLPLLPLLITAIFLENRRMMWAGIVLACFAAVVLGCHILLVYGAGIAVSITWIHIWTAATCLLDIVPGVMLLLFGRALKRT